MRQGEWFKSIVLVLVAALLLAQPLTSAQANQASAQALHKLRPAATLSPLSVYADFDQDSQLDRAELFSHGNGREIQITLGGLLTTHLHFESAAPDGGRLFTGDIDHDNDADLIWVSYTEPGETAAWFGDGQGRFTAAPQPQDFANAVNELLGGREDNSVSQGPGVPDASATLPNHHPYLPSNRKIEVVFPPTPALISTDDERALSPVVKHLRKRGPPELLS